MITKEQKDILDDIEYSCDTLKETNRGMQILADVRNERWYYDEQIYLIYLGLKFLGRNNELEKVKNAFNEDGFLKSYELCYQLCQKFQNHEALYLIAAGLIDDGQDVIAFELANDLNDYCKDLEESRLRKGRMLREGRRPMRRRMNEATAVANPQIASKFMGKIEDLSRELAKYIVGDEWNSNVISRAVKSLNAAIDHLEDVE